MELLSLLCRQLFYRLLHSYPLKEYFGGDCSHSLRSVVQVSW